MSRPDPVPKIPLRDDPTQDSIWKRWLETSFKLATAYVGGPISGVSTDNAVARWDGTDGRTLQNSGVTIDDSNNVSGVNDLTVNGNTTLGDTSTDTYTNNAGTWTYGSNVVATRAVGNAPAGVIAILETEVSATGDSGGTTNLRGQLLETRFQGGNIWVGATAVLNGAIHEGTNNIATGTAYSATFTITSSGSITTAICQQGGFVITGTGLITDGLLFNANAPTFTSTGAITTLRGFRSGNLGHATMVNSALAHDALNMTPAVTQTVSFRSAQNSGTGCWGFQHTGTANNALNGFLRLGSGTVVPTAALDVTGGGIFSSTFSVSSLTVTSNAYVVSSLACNYLTVSSAGGQVTASTYTPTISSIANLDAVTSFQAQWMRIGKVVSVSGKVQLDPTAPATLTRLGFSLPVASNLANQEDCAGTAFASGIAGQGAAIRAEATNDQAELVYISGDVTVQPMYYLYQYEIL